LKKGVFSYEYVFEPSPEKVLEAMLPRLIEMQIYQAVLESEASEHSARMMAMKNATEAAGDMIHDLTLIYNQARQAGITQELAEISSGAAALE
jgi:F-type H+-transporting ATPase subunit gamma